MRFVRHFSRLLFLGALAFHGTRVHAEAPSQEASAPPLEKIDRSRIIGAPVLDHAPRGVVVWLEDGWYQIAAVTALPIGGKVAASAVFSVTVRTTKPMTQVDLQRWEKKGQAGDELVFQVKAGPDPERMRFQTAGEITVLKARDVREEEPLPIFVGPLAKPAARSVRIGRF